MHAPKDIRDLRKADQLEEAYQLALGALQEEPESLYIRREMGWVLYGMVKKAIQEKDLDAVLNRMEEFFGLDLTGPEEAMVHQNLFQQGVNALFKFFDPKANKTQFQEPVFRQILGFLDQLEFEKPGKEYSWKLRAILRMHEYLDDLAELALKWDLTHLRPEDFEPEEYQGKKLPSLAEKAYNAVGRALSEGKVQPDPFGRWEMQWDEEAITSFLPDLKRVSEVHSDWWFLHLYRARLMRITGEPMEEVRKAMLPLVKKKSGDFWVWQELAETYADDPEMQLACLSRAMLCRSPARFLVNIHQFMAEVLIREERYAEARTEIDQLVQTREKEGWKIPGPVQGWMRSAWYASASGKGDNRDMYARLAPKADEVLHVGLPWRVAVIEGVHPHKPMAFYRIDRSNAGHVPTEMLSEKVQPGDLVELRIENRKGKKGTYAHVLAARAYSGMPPDGLVKDLEGTIRRKEGQPFAFLEGVFYRSRIGTGI